MAVLMIRERGRCGPGRLFADGRCVHCLGTVAAKADAWANRGLDPSPLEREWFGPPSVDTAGSDLTERGEQ